MSIGWSQKTDTLSFSTKKDTIDTEDDFKSNVVYGAKDTILSDLEHKLIYLYKDAFVNYEDLNLKADYIVINYGENTAIAEGMPDSTGKIKGKPEMKDGNQTYFADKIIYNFKTQRGKVFGVRTQLDQDQYIKAEALKRSNEGKGVYYIQNGKFTTCNAEDPHYYFLSKKMKVIPNDKVVTGPVQAYIEDVPLPFVLPFGYFPNKSGAKSGVIFPTYGESAQRGFFLRDGGYYFAISPKMDLSVRGDIYSKGGYGAVVSGNYKVIHRLDGNFSIRRDEVPSSDPSDAIQVKPYKAMRVSWTHSQPFSPTARFTANVNAGTTNSNLTVNNPEVNLQTTLQSSISFSKTWTGKPYALSANLNHNQNNQTKIVTLGLPNVAFSKSRTTPFKSKNSVKNHFYDNIGYSYNVNVLNQISAPDSIVFSNRASRYFQYGINHTLPIDANFKVLKYFTLNPSFSYQERWYTQQYQQSFNTTTQIVKVDTTFGFHTLRSFSTGVSMSTTLYGTKLFNKGRLMGFRHVMVPSAAFTLTPDYGNSFWRYYSSYQNANQQTIEYVKYNGVFGTVSNGGRQQNLSVGLNNTFDLKVKKKVIKEGETNYEPKIVHLLEGLSAGASYNLAADSLKLSNIGTSARTRVLNIINLAASANFDPYVADTSGRIRYNRLEIDQFGWQKGRVARMPSASLTLGLALSADLFKRKKSTNNNNNTNNPTNPNAVNTEAQYLYVSRYVDFEVPWTFTANYNLIYTQPGAAYTSNVSNIVTFSADVNLTAKWKIAGNSGIDFNTKQLSYTNVSIIRDLHCWELRFNWIPLGLYQSYTLEFNIKSSLLRDIKVNRKRNWLDNYRP